MLLLVAARPGFPDELVPGFRQEAGRWVFSDPYPADRPRATGLQHRFPPMPGLDVNPVSPEKVELGRLLFFDPVLSGDNTISCATCHQPDLGLADGRPRGMGLGGVGSGPDRRGGKELARNTPSLWNAAFQEWLFWDGRERGLENQAGVPLTNPDEMAAEPEALVAELRDIPEYVARFGAAFGGEGTEAVTYDRARQALASFERTLLSFDSKFDRYAAGDFSALNASEKNGLKLFRSLNTRCFECHSFPTFSDGSFRILGVPDEGDADLGRGGVLPHAADASFRVPSLRNVELSAPYMHNGSLATLEDVIKFYAEGGGRREAKPVAFIDDKVRKFDITPEETADLVAFLKALTDASLEPAAPERVPSGLPVVGPGAPKLESQVAAASPTPERAPSPSPASVPAAVAAPMPEEAAPQAPPPLERAKDGTIAVREGQSIQAAVDLARPGDRIEIGPGLFRESVRVRTSNVTIAGSAGDRRTVLDGKGVLEAGITVEASGISLARLTLRHYAVAGVIAVESDMPNLEDLLIEPLPARAGADPGRP